MFKVVNLSFILVVYNYQTNYCFFVKMNIYWMFLITFGHV